MEILTFVFPVVKSKPHISLWSPTPGWDVSLCAQVESVVCQCFPVYYLACQKNSGKDMRGINSGELHPILFFFSFFTSKRCFFWVKRVVFPNTISMCWHPSCEVLKLAKKHCQRAALWCHWTPKVQHERADFVYVRVYLLTTSPCCYSSLTSP